MTYEEATAALVASGRFGQLDGFSGFCPVQAFGTLTTGEEFSFRARGKGASVELRRGEEGMIFNRYEVVAVWPMAGYLEADRCLALVTKWLDEYAAKGPDADPYGVGETQTVV